MKAFYSLKHATESLGTEYKGFPKEDTTYQHGWVVLDLKEYGLFFHKEHHFWHHNPVKLHP